MDPDIPISHWRARHYVQRAALSGVLFTSAAALHDFGPLVLGNDSLHLKQQIVFRALAQGELQLLANFISSHAGRRIRHQVFSLP